MRRFKNFEGFSFFFEGLVSSLDFLYHSPNLLLTSSNVLSLIESYDKIAYDSFTTHILLNRDFCAVSDLMTLSEVIRFKSLGCSVLRVTITSKCIIVKSL